MSEHSSDRSQSNVLERVRQLSSDDSCVSHREFDRLLKESPEGPGMPLTDWHEVVNFTSDQCARWHVEWLFSPAASPNEAAAEELEGWRQLHEACLAALVEHVPEMKNHLDQRQHLAALQYALRRRLEQTERRRFARSFSAALSWVAILLRTLGAKNVARRLYARALYPEGTVGRAEL